MQKIFWTLCAISYLTAASSLQAAELLPADRPVEAVVDHYVDQLNQADKVTVAAQADDATLIRRLTLDLAGRIPTTSESRDFVASTSPTKRVELVDRLLGSPDYVFHQRNELDYMLQPSSRGSDDFRKYLTWAVEQNRPWNSMFQDMLIGDENDEQQKAALQFVRKRANSVDDMTNDTSVLFFGVNVSCAKCHDHPLVEDWKQDHYYGLTSFFSRTYSGKKDRIGEKFSGEVKFKTTKGVEKQAQFMFLTGAVIEEPKIERSAEDKKKIDEQIKQQTQNDNPPPMPKPEFSPRQKLVELALREGDNSFFSKNIANRIWARLLGRGLVDPVDQLHSQNPASHPELLDWLARDLVTHNYDMKRVVRGIALAQAYSRSSRWESAAEVPEPKYFALSTPRAMTPRQYALSLLVASSNPTQFPPADKPDEWKKRREGLESNAGGLAGTFELPKEGFQVAVDEALFFSNSGRAENELLRDSGDKLIGHLKTIPDQRAMLEAACWAVVSRAPTEDEITAMSGYLGQRASQPAEALKQTIWALMAGPELRFNY